MDLIYWRQPLISCAVFSTLFVLLLSFSLFSFISVTAYVSLMVLCATMSYVLFKKIAAAVQKTGEGHPFQELLERRRRHGGAQNHQRHVSRDGNEGKERKGQEKDKEGGKDGARYEGLTPIDQIH